jgi:hypothetical protein
MGVGGYNGVGRVGRGLFTAILLPDENGLQDSNQDSAKGGNAG